ncbi:MAG: phosphatase PAP2 family protein [Patescibacteria group bacterium]
MNENIFYFLNNLALQNEIFDTLIIFIADWLIWWLIFIVVALIIFKKITWRLACQVIGVAIFSWGLVEFFQFFWSSPRPFLVLDNINLLFTYGANDSFPSGNTVFATTLSVAFYYSGNKKTGIIFFVGAVLIGLSRVIVGIHWPVDILAGLILGVLIPTIIAEFFRGRILASPKSVPQNTN